MGSIEEYDRTKRSYKSTCMHEIQRREENKIPIKKTNLRNDKLSRSDQRKRFEKYDR